MTLIVLCSCSTPATPTAPAPTATLIPTLAPPSSPSIPAQIVDRELLGASNVVAACDASPEATFTCENAESAPLLTVATTASTFARWSLQWQSDTPLTGDETVTIRLTSGGTLAPNFYLVTTEGERQSVPLARFGFEAGTQTFHIPLREVRDEKGESPNFATINGLEIVFEWADMQGTMVIESLRIDTIWAEAVTVGDEAITLASTLEAPQGFHISAVAENVQGITQIDFTDSGEMLVSEVSGRVWLFRDHDDDGVYDERILYTVGTLDLVGLLYDATDGGVWLGSRGQLMHTLDSDGNGVADTRTMRFEGVDWGRHQNNGMVWNPDPDPFTGEPNGTWLYFGLGSVEDLEVGSALNATILRFPRTGDGVDDLEVVSIGNRNAYDVVWANLPVTNTADAPRAWQLFASENGPDFNDAPDELNHIRWQHHYGFPDQFGNLEEGQVEGEPYSAPVYEITPHASADGIAYIDNPTWPEEYRTIYVALFGEIFSPAPVGHIIERVTLRPETTPAGEVTYRGESSPFIVGLDRPLPLVTTDRGTMLVGDYATGVIYEIEYAGEDASVK
jgi:hypothetical protein